MADAGVASRRACEELIVMGVVQVNGKVVRELGSKFNPKNIELVIEGRKISLKKSKLYIAFYKPRGVLSSMEEPGGRLNLGNYFSIHGKFNSLFEGENSRVYHVGRLDKESEGLILLTNDGDFAYRLTHPKFGIRKTYLVEVEGELTKTTLVKWTKGITIEDGIAKAIKATLVRSKADGTHWIEVVLDEGRNQIIRKMCKASGLKVKQLIRTQMGNVKIGELKSGRYRILSDVEVEKLFNL